MIHPEVVVLAVVAMAALVTLSRFKGIPQFASRKSAMADDSVARLDGRIARLEQAVDTIAIEMERIGESQRFLTKVLAERPTEKKENS
jgi:type II secretory pathway pseudopilin PulG